MDLAPAAVPVVPTSDEYAHFTACDACRKRKKKCDGKIAGCDHCATKHIPCVYSSKKPRVAHARQDLSAKADGIMERLGRLEQVFYTNIGSETRPPSAGEGGSRDALPQLPRAASGEPAFGLGVGGGGGGGGDGGAAAGWELAARPRRQTASGSGMSQVRHASSSSSSDPFTMMLGDSPGQRPGWAESVASSPSTEGDVGVGAHPVSQPKDTKIFIGSSSPFSFFSAASTEWFNQQLGNTAYSDLFKQVEAAWGPSQGAEQADVFSGDFLSDPETTDQSQLLTGDPEVYVAEYFSAVNNWLPLFDEASFRAGPPDPYRDAAAWHCARNIVYALGAQSLAHKVPDPLLMGRYEATAWWYFRSASRTIPRLILTARLPLLVTVQALLGMIMFLWETDHAQPINTLVGLASSLGAQMGFHRDARKMGVPAHQADQMRNVFWITYMLDKDVALRSGRPTTIVDPDISVPLPPAGKSLPQRYLADRVTLAKTSSLICRLLYPADAVELSGQAVQGIVAMLQHELDKWHDSTPWVKRPIEELAAHLYEQGLSTDWWIRMRFAYFNALTSVHRYSSTLLLPPPSSLMQGSRSTPFQALGPGDGGDDPGTLKLLAFARREATSAVRLCYTHVFAGAKKSHCLILCVGQFLLFAMSIRTRSRVDHPLMSSIAHCMNTNDWGRDSPTLIRMFTVLCNGLSQIAERGPAKQR